MAFRVDVHEVHFGFAAVAAHGVVSGRVDVPAFEVERLVVVVEAWVRGPVAVVLEREGGAVVPVEEITGDVGWVIEDGDVV